MLCEILVVFTYTTHIDYSLCLVYKHKYSNTHSQNCSIFDDFTVWYGLYQVNILVYIYSLPY